MKKAQRQIGGGGGSKGLEIGIFVWED